MCKWIAISSAPEEGLEEVGETGSEKVLRFVSFLTTGKRSSVSGLLVLFPVSTEFVVLRSLGGIAEHFVRFSNFLEFFFCLLVAGVLVRMILNGELAVGLLDFLLTGFFAYTQRCIVILVIHKHPRLCITRYVRAVPAIITIITAFPLPSLVTFGHRADRIAAGGIFVRRERALSKRIWQWLLLREESRPDFQCRAA